MAASVNEAAGLRNRMSLRRGGRGAQGRLHMIADRWRSDRIVSRGVFGENRHVMAASAQLIRSLTLLGLALALLAVVVVGAVWVSLRQERESALVVHTLEVEMRLMGFLSRLQDGETGQRGYLLTGVESYLESYDWAISRIDGELAELVAAVRDNPVQMRSAGRLREIVAARVALLKETVELAKAGQREAAIDKVRSGLGRSQMNEARQIIGLMVAEEDRLLAERRAAAAASAEWMRIVLFTTFALIGFVSFLAWSEYRGRYRQATAARDRMAALNDALVKEAAERQSAENKLRHIQKMETLGQLTGGVAHDFNNMLAIVIGSLDMARRRLTTDPGKVPQALDMASEGAQRAATLTSRLLAFARRQPLAPTVIDANKLVSGMSELLRRTIGGNIELETVLAGGLWRTFADPPQLENVIVNLCVNARDAMPDGGKLTIETANGYLDDIYAAHHDEVVAGQYVQICVTDTGAGMTPDVIERAFDPFFTTKAVGQGTGLGLSQVFGFVKQTGGHVKIYSEIGQGTTIKIYLRRHVGEGEAAAEPAPANVEIVGGDEIILVVEDDPGVRAISVDALRELGYTVLHASGGAEALERLRALPRVDLIFTDIVMPGMSGRQLAEAAQEMRPGVKILYTTGYTRNAVVHNGMLDAGVAMITKPFTLGQLAVKVRRVLDGGGANRPA